MADSPLRFFGLELGTRMTVMRLPGSKLILHSPVPAVPELIGQVQALGDVAYIVAPNRFHHLYVGEWQRAFPDASVFVAPGVERKRPELNIKGVLVGRPEDGWADSVDQVLVQGIPFTSEVAFFHRPSATLVVSDLAFNIGPASPPLTRLVFRAGGTYGRLSPSALEPWLIRDRNAFRDSLEQILAWPFERVVVAHGAISEVNGRAELTRGYAWILGGGAGSRDRPLTPRS